MNETVAYLVVLVAAATPWLEVLIVVPAGIVAGLSPVATAVVGAVGNVATLVPLVLGGDRVRRWWRHRRDGEDSGPSRSIRRGARARRLFDRYGLPGLAALGPLLTGIHLAAIVALAAGADRRRSLAWLAGGVIVWSALAAAATVLGVEALVDPGSLPDLGTD